MANLVRWTRPSMTNLQRELEDVFDELAAPRSIRREMERLFDDFGSPRALWRQMDQMVEEFDAPPTLGSRIARVFENFLGETKRLFKRTPENFVPDLDLVEQGNEYVMKADLPGMREQDIDIEVSDDNVLTLSGQRREEETRNERGYEYHERSYGSFSRSIELPASADTAKIRADFHDGVLELHVPKTETAPGRKIPLSRTEEPRVIAAGDGPRAQVQQKSSQAQPARGS